MNMGTGAARSELYKKEKEKKMEAYTSFAQVYDLLQHKEEGDGRIYRVCESIRSVHG